MKIYPRFVDNMQPDPILETAQWPVPKDADEYTWTFQIKRTGRKITRLLKEEHIWIKGWHSDSKRISPWIVEYQKLVADFGRILERKTPIS